MNIGNILKVADAIEQASVPGLGFNMVSVKAHVSEDVRDMSGHNCGTVACISGWAVTVLPHEEVAAAGFTGTLFGMKDGPEFDALVIPYGWDTDPNRFTAEAAVRVLRILAITGKVDWEAAMKGDEPVLPPLPASRALVKQLS